MSRGLKDCEIEEYLNFDESDGLSEGEDVYNASSMERKDSDTSESESDDDSVSYENIQKISEDITSAVPSPALEIEIEGWSRLSSPSLRSEISGTSAASGPSSAHDFENEDIHSPFLPPQDVCSTTGRKSRGLSRGRKPRGRARSLSNRRGVTSEAPRGGQVTRGRPAIRGRRLNRGRGARVRARGVSPRPYYDSADWKGNKFSHEIPNLRQPSYIERDLEDFEPTDFYKDYIDDSILQKIVLESNRTAILKTGKSFGLTLKELKVFLGINFVMSCINYPHIRMYWARKWKIPIIADNMIRDRFFKIRTSLKIVFDGDISSSEKASDKLWKVRPLFVRILQGCLRQDRSQHICIDEMIIPFSGSCGIRQYVPNKPNPLGIKVLVLANKNGIVCDMFVYQGDTTFCAELTNKYSVSECSVLRLTESLVPGHIIYFDRFFTTVRLVQTLLERGFLSVGTIMKNRIPKEVSLMSDKDMRLRGRGCCYTALSTDGHLAITKWFDNKPVLMLSSCYAAEKTDLCERWSKKKKAYEMVVRPEVIKEYNTNMGGVDLVDRMLSIYPSRARTQKWTIRFILHCFDLAVVNSWLLYREKAVNKNIPQNDILQMRAYKLLLGENLIEENVISSDEDNEYDSEGELAPRHKKRKVEIAPVPSSLRRQHKALHMPMMTEKQSRCRQTGCLMKSRTKCSSCNVYLCLTVQRNCYTDFHTKKQ